MATYLIREEFNESCSFLQKNNLFFGEGKNAEAFGNGVFRPTSAIGSGLYQCLLGCRFSKAFCRSGVPHDTERPTPAGLWLGAYDSEGESAFPLIF